MYEYSEIINDMGNELSMMNLGTSKFENNPTYYQVMIKIGSHFFQGEHPFSYYKEDVESIIKNLNKMHDELKGSVTMGDDDESDSHLTLEMKKYGHMLVYGQLGGTHTGTYLNFKFESDQTILPGLTTFLESLLDTTE
jgi:hypothetical protein